jgi:hypothetical protein
MNKSIVQNWLVFAVALWLAALPSSPARAQSTALTYQGQLGDAGGLASGLHDFSFRLYDVATGGVQIGSTLCVDNVDVIDGVFTVQLDFGQQYATTAQRYLEIEVRHDTGLPCSDAGGFVVMAPRQQLTAAPMASHANAAFALDAADGSPVNAVFVDDTGRVGIGTTDPGSKVDIQASDNSNVLFGRRTGGGLTHNLWIDSQGNGSMQLLDGAGTTRISLGCCNTTYFNYGNVGIGTIEPTAKLDVRGDIRLGPTGQFQAAAGVENLRLLRGTVSQAGAIMSGSGFTSERLSTGRYLITFSTPFSGLPTITVNARGIQGHSQDHTVSSVVIMTYSGSQVLDAVFDFCLMGPR